MLAARKTLESNYAAIDRRAVEHEEKDEERFIRTMERFDSLEKAVSTKIDVLWDNKNKQEGIIGFSKLLAGGFGGLVVAGL